MKSHEISSIAQRAILRLHKKKVTDKFSRFFAFDDDYLKIYDSQNSLSILAQSENFFF